uniref:Helicase-primase primase subunit n=1 Tax=Gallid alphaherpesvirus 2 TaxID=10390 RepID=A0A2H4V7J5_9ALPH|nr:helicase-primase primase subunit [Gallid alphaherpesvirus 2]
MARFSSISDTLESDDSGIKVLFAVDGCAVSFSLALLTGQIPSTNSVYVIGYWDPSDRFSSIPFLDGDPNTNERISTTVCNLEDVPSPLRVEFCLLNQMTSGMGGADLKLRTRAIFVCRFTSWSEMNAIANSIIYGTPIQAGVLQATISETETFMLHDEFNLALHVFLNGLSLKGRNKKDVCMSLNHNYISSVSENFPRGKRGLTGLYLQHEQKVTAAYRRIYGGSTTTAFWYVSKFGPDEKSLVLALRYYLLQAQEEVTGIATGYDLQAIKDICKTYAVSVNPNPTGFLAADLTSFSRLSRFCCLSYYSKGSVAIAFPSYVERRIMADIAEVDALREYIERDRPSLKISDLEFVKYIYLAYFECYNREQLKRHLKDVTVSLPDEDIYKKSSLGKCAVENFFTHVRSRLNVNDHIAHNVLPEQVEMGNKLVRKFGRARMYLSTTMTNESHFTGICECASVILKRLDTLEMKLQKYGWPSDRVDGSNLMADNQNNSTLIPYDKSRSSGMILECSNTHSRGGPMIVKRLLALVSADSRAGGIGPANMLMGIDSAIDGPLPVYRVGMSKGRQAFTVLMTECWERTIPSPGSVKAHLSKLNNSYGTSTEDLISRDLFLTSEIEQLIGSTVELPEITCGSADEQQYINRNEVFNGNLAIGNIVLDVDIHLRNPIPLRLMHAAIRGFRSGILRALALLLPKANIDHGSYPCYFYKSSCKKSRVMGGAPWMLHDAELAPDYSMFENAEFDLEMGIDDPLLIDQIDESLTRWSSESSRSVDLDPDKPCGCHDKIGLRVCIPVPSPYLLVGSKTLAGLSRIIQQAVLLERNFVETIGPYLKNYEIIDSGVYGHGRSLRLPFFGKIDENGIVSRRLVPFFVIPDDCADMEKFIVAHFEPKNFHFHSSIPLEKAAIILKDIGGEYAGFFERKITVNRDIFFGTRLSLSIALRERGVDINDCAAITTFVTDHILDDIITYVYEHIPDHAIEYQNLSVSCCVVKSDWILLQLIPNKTIGYRHGFTCVRFKHARARRASARSYLALNVDAHGRLCVCVIQQCFAAKCGNNKLRTLFTVDIDSKCRLEHQ